jgi:hypothetical protein
MPLLLSSDTALLKSPGNLDSFVQAAVFPVCGAGGGQERRPPGSFAVPGTFVFLPVCTEFLKSIGYVDYV